MGTQAKKGDGYLGEKVRYFYRGKGSEDWKDLATYNLADDTGFHPLAVDPEANLVYGLKRHSGRNALFSMALDQGLETKLVFAHPEVDVDNVVRVGRHRRVVGATFATEKREVVYFDKQVAAMQASLRKALPDQPQSAVLDSSLDGSIMLLWAGSDVDPGNYYVFDRNAKRLNKILLARPELQDLPLAPMKHVTVRASDGTMIPGYLTLPRGSEGKGLPSIVMPHGGPEARDEWGFDWLVQYYANRGFAVLQPNFRGSTGYGDSWFQNNGYKSWRIAVSDVVDAGRWLVAEGIADPSKLAVVGWSYGGYAALQSNVLAPDLYKAVVAIAPVTDFKMKIEASRGWSSYLLARERFGTGPHIRDGSPLQNVAAFKAPVLMFHGDYDRNVEVRQSQLMADRLKEAGKKQELIIYPRIDHYIADSQLRADMLRRSDRFLRTSMGM
ncbi:MAG: S9 family peptidase [Sphingosinicella sp.]|nr:S9 family peptidase [Sphingosinicella sp.]